MLNRRNFELALVEMGRDYNTHLVNNKKHLKAEIR